MGFSFRKRIKIAPGITLNVSKSGLTTTLGPRGAKVTLGGKRGTRTTLSIPGTGLSYVQTRKAPTSAPPRSGARGLFFLLVAIAAAAFMLKFVLGHVA